MGVVLLLGPVAFQAFEVPPYIRFGGKQRLAVHTLPGGARVIDAMGRDDATIAFEGVFTGADATARARLLDVLRAEGGVLPLTWDVFFYSVVISDFEAEYHNGWWIPFRLSCTVLRDEAQGITAAVLDLASEVSADLGVAAGLSASAGLMLPGGQDAASLMQAQAQIAGGMASAEAALARAGGLAESVAACGQLAALSSAAGYVARGAANLRQAGR
jgi:hypothetical protein